MRRPSFFWSQPARVLADEGWTKERINSFFGITREPLFRRGLKHSDGGIAAICTSRPWRQPTTSPKARDYYYRRTGAPTPFTTSGRMGHGFENASDRERIFCRGKAARAEMTTRLKRMFLSLEAGGAGARAALEATRRGKGDLVVKGAFGITG